MGFNSFLLLVFLLPYHDVERAVEIMLPGAVCEGSDISCTEHDVGGGPAA